MLLLRGDTDRAVVGVAGAHPETANRLNGCIGDSDRIRAQSERLYEIALGSKPARDHQCHFRALEHEVTPGAGQRHHRRDRNVVFEDVGRGPGCATAAVDNDVVDPNLEGEVDVGFDVLRAHLEADWNAAGGFTHFVGDAPEVRGAMQVGKGRRADCGLPWLEPSHRGDLWRNFVAREMPARAGLGALSSFEVKRLALLHLFDAPAEAPRRELVEVAGVVRLLLGQHAALARADPGARHLRALRQRDLGLSAQRSKAHVADEQRNVEP